MSKGLGPALTALAGGSAEPAAQFEFHVSSTVWTWSPELFEMYGFELGEVVPTTELVLAHQHPADRPQTDRVFAEALATGQPFCRRYRIITNRQQERAVISIGAGQLDDDGQVVSVHGYVIDISDAVRHASIHEIQDAVDKSAATRAQIEQAKGALMIVHAISAEDAFAMLRWHSFHTNRKLRDIARWITEGMHSPATPTETPQGRLGRLLGALASSPDPQTISAGSRPDRDPPGDPRQPPGR